MVQASVLLLDVPTRCATQEARQLRAVVQR
jgi:hypothetical protein